MITAPPGIDDQAFITSSILVTRGINKFQPWDFSIARVLHPGAAALVPFFDECEAAIDIVFDVSGPDTKSDNNVNTTCFIMIKSCDLQSVRNYVMRNTNPPWRGANPPYIHHIPGLKAGFCCAAGIRRSTHCAAQLHDHP